MSVGFSLYDRGVSLDYCLSLATFFIHSVRWAGAGGWSGVREKYCWLAGGWKLVLEQCERKTLLGWRLLELPNRVILVYAVVVA